MNRAGERQGADDRSHDVDAGVDTTRHFVRARHFLSLSTSYYRSEEWRSAVALLIATFSLRLGLAGVALSLNRWEKLFFDALADRHTAALLPLVAGFGLLGLISVAVAAGDIFFRELLSIRWRRWMTRERIDRWLSDRRCLTIERDTLLDNPDQRIAEDIRLFAYRTLDLATNFVSVAASSIGFGIVLWHASAKGAGATGGVAIVGDLFWSALIYAAAGSVAVLVFLRPLVRRTMRQEKYEADFRFELVSLRHDAAHVAADRAETHDRERTSAALDALVRNAVALLRVRSGLQGFTSMFSLMQSIIPLMIVTPRFFSGAMSLGDVMQVRGAFIAFAVSLSWFVQNFAQLGALAATANRLFTLDTMLARPPAGI